MSKCRLLDVALKLSRELRKAGEAFVDRLYRALYRAKKDLRAGGSFDEKPGCGASFRRRQLTHPELILLSE